MSKSLPKPKPVSFVAKVYNLEAGFASLFVCLFVSMTLFSLKGFDYSRQLHNSVECFIFGVQFCFQLL